MEPNELAMARNPTDTEMLNWLQKNTKGLWINGLGWIRRKDDKVTIRAVIIKAMKSGF